MQIYNVDCNEPLNEQRHCYDMIAIGLLQIYITVSLPLPLIEPRKEHLEQVISKHCVN